MGELLSIIVPVYNAEKYLEECLDSVISQEYANLEIILVDDGSTDKSKDICDEYEKKDSRIKVIHKENGGASSARNAGLYIAKGEYIGFVDSDDYISESLFSILLQALLETDADIAKCGFQEFKYNDFEIEKRTGKKRVFTRKEAIYNFLTVEYSPYKEMNVLVNAALFKRKMFDNIKFPDVPMHEDTYISPKLFLESEKIVYVDESLYFYRQNENSVMRTDFSEKNLKCIDVFKEIHFWITEIYPEFGKYTIDKWVSKYISDYNRIIKSNGFVDADDYYKNYIIKGLEDNISYFKKNGASFKTIRRAKKFLKSARQGKYK